MELSFEIKTGQLECELTGDTVDILIKASNGEVSSGWLSLAVMEQCLKFLRACRWVDKEGAEDQAIDDDDIGNTLRLILGEVQSIGKKITSLPVQPAVQPAVQPTVAPAVPSQFHHFAPVANSNHEIPQQTITNIPSSSTPVSKSLPSARDKMAKKQFAEEIAELINNPPVDDNPMAKSKGLAESHIRDCIHKWKNLFEDKMVMWQVVNAAFGMSRERFDTIIKSNPTPGL